MNSFLVHAVDGGEGTVFVIRVSIFPFCSLCSILSDIECVKLTGKGFPDAKVDPVIQIGTIVSVQGEKLMLLLVTTDKLCLPFE